MSDMVERVARAICFSRDACESCHLGCRAGTEALRKSSQWTKAVAAIAAMREPTAAMVVAGAAEECDQADLPRAYSAMIDAALRE